MIEGPATSRPRLTRDSRLSLKMAGCGEIAGALSCRDQRGVRQFAPCFRPRRRRRRAQQRQRPDHRRPAFGTNCQARASRAVVECCNSAGCPRRQYTLTAAVRAVRRRPATICCKTFGQEQVSIVQARSAIGGARNASGERPTISSTVPDMAYAVRWLTVDFRLELHSFGQGNLPRPPGAACLPTPLFRPPPPTGSERHGHDGAGVFDRGIPSYIGAAGVDDLRRRMRRWFTPAAG